MPQPSSATPVRLAFCITELDPGGAERAFVRIVTGLDRTCWEPHVFCLGPPGELAAVLKAAGIPVTCFGAVRWWQLGVVWRFARELRSLKPALLQTFLYHANIMGRMAGWLAGVPLIVSGIRVAERRSGFRLWLERITAGLVAAHVCVSRAVASFSIETGGLPPDRVVVIPNGVDVAQYAAAEPADLGEFGFHEGDPVVLFVGRLEPQKNPQLLLQAFRQVRQEVPAARLLMVGEGRLRKELEAIISADPQLSESVRLCGYRSDVPRLMRAAKVFALSSRWEGMPNVVLEALAAGLPVVATDVEGVAELLGDGQFGAVVPAGEADLFASELLRLLTRPVEPAGADKVSQGHVQEHFTWGVVVESYDRLYRNLLENQSVGGRAGRSGNGKFQM